MRVSDLHELLSQGLGAPGDSSVSPNLLVALVSNLKAQAQAGQCEEASASLARAEQVYRALGSPAAYSGSMSQARAAVARCIGHPLDVLTTVPGAIANGGDYEALGTGTNAQRLTPLYRLRRTREGQYLDPVSLGARRGLAPRGGALAVSGMRGPTQDQEAQFHALTRQARVSALAGDWNTAQQANAAAHQVFAVLADPGLQGEMTFSDQVVSGDPAALQDAAAGDALVAAGEENQPSLADIIIGDAPGFQIAPGLSAGDAVTKAGGYTSAAGITTPQSGADLVATQAAKKNLSKFSTNAKAIATGAGVGVAVGAGAGAALGKSTGALAGGITGGILGGILGYALGGEPKAATS